MQVKHLFLLAHVFSRSRKYEYSLLSEVNYITLSAFQGYNQPLLPVKLSRNPETVWANFLIAANIIHIFHSRKCAFHGKS